MQQSLPMSCYPSPAIGSSLCQILFHFASMLLSFTPAKPCSSPANLDSFFHLQMIVETIPVDIYFGHHSRCDTGPRVQSKTNSGFCRPSFQATFSFYSSRTVDMTNVKSTQVLVPQKSLVSQLPFPHSWRNHQFCNTVQQRIKCTFQYLISR